MNIPRYVDSAESAESCDIHASMFGGIPQHEINILEPYWAALPGLRDALFTKLAGPYASYKTSKSLPEKNVCLSQGCAA